MKVAKKKAIITTLIVFAALAYFGRATAQDTMGFSFNIQTVDEITTVKIRYINKQNGKVRKSSDYYFRLLRKSNNILSTCEDTIIDFAFFPCRDERNFIYIDDLKQSPKLVTLKRGQKQRVEFKFKLDKLKNYYYREVIYDLNDPSKSFQILIKLNGNEHQIIITKDLRH